MTTSRDDDALHWAGDDDPTLTPPIQAGTAPAAAPAPAATTAPAQDPTVLEQAELAEDARVEAELAAAEKASAQLSSAALITLGILGGIYLLYTIGWAIVVARTTVTFFPLDSLFLEVCFRIGQFLSIAAAPLWFVSALLLTQKRTWRSRLGWLLLGVFVLVPWPFIQGA
ncbi:DNA polymerase III subunit gamma/tau [Agreia sp. PsM10]|uniref:DNA polymerase III subunit gamma/tau n=1 Tax=Agreia sp. PsM10 TaxID=3030533 RepID=UPI00263B94B2|nr:DNA polymerase III subunit gamma/tau [Agreia sp. PsM10]MDN4639375.1 DNA polymerase III subunit gamma/tau [Agreia sp. PsM10]